MCLPGLHITLGVFLRLFTLLEDECAKLDLEMAASASLQPGDRQGYIDHTSLIQKERALLDERSTTEGALKWLITECNKPIHRPPSVDSSQVVS